ncbi:MAG: uracil phosphoribosyltransferase [Alphaproteobacteria bacterium]
MSLYPNLHVIEHPLLQHKLSHLRDQTTSSSLFRQLLTEISLLMGYEVTRQLSLKQRPLETPLEPMMASFLEQKIAIVPILRAGLGMVEGFLELLPFAKTGHIGLYRDTKDKPVEYFVKLPGAKNHLFFLLDPMLATGHSAAHAAKLLLQHGVDSAQIRLVCIVASPEGVATFNKTCSEVPIFTASLDRCLSEKNYILPGLGDAGDRLFGTCH